jgi:leucyl-tRNA synthetase
MEEVVTIPVQINGRLRSKVELSRGADEQTLKQKVLADEKTQNYLKDLTVKRWVIIPDKLVNIVVKQ